MSRLNKIHNGSEILLKSDDGFKVGPIAGPILDRHDTEAVIESPKSKPNEQAITQEIIAMII